MIKPDSSGEPMVNLLMRGLGRVLPTDYANKISPELYQNLKRRNAGLDRIAQGLCIAGLVGGLLVPLWVRGRPLQIKAWDIGVQFGMAVALPVAFVLLMTVFRGKMRFREYLLFYSAKYGMDARKLFLFVYGPMVLLGFVCAYFSYRE